MYSIDKCFVLAHCAVFSRSSGLGDHGRHGLQLFIDEHVCNYICRSLKLASRATLQETLNAIGSAVTDDDDL